LRAYQVLLREIGGIILVIIGLHLTGVLKLSIFYWQKQFAFRPGRPSYPASLLIGIIFALGWTPCVGLILGHILGLAANAATLRQGVSLLLFYSLGFWGLTLLLALPALVAVVSGVTAVVLVIVLGAFLVYQPDVYRRGMRLLIPKRHEPVFDESWKRTGKGLRKWVGGIVVSMTLMGTLTAVAGSVTPLQGLRQDRTAAYQGIRFAAVRAGAHLSADPPFALSVCSPLLRARQTADIIGASIHLKPVIIHELTEMTDREMTRVLLGEVVDRVLLGRGRVARRTARCVRQGAERVPAGRGRTPVARGRRF